MIEQIRIKNFQSHKSTQLKFHPGVNTIVGSSDSGKTAIMRALFWVVQNRPLGSAFVSHWALNEKGKQAEPCWALVTTNDKKIKRVKLNEKNSYIIDSKILEAMRTEVPPEVSHAFNLTDVNIQKQMDSPFLLSESAGEVARFFNRIIRLDIIDTFLSSVDSKKRETKKQCLAFEADTARLEKELEELGWIDGADRLTLKAQRIGDKIDITQETKDELEAGIESHEEYSLEISEIPDVDKAGKLIRDWNATLSLAEDIEDTRQRLQESITRWTDSSELIEKELPDLDKTQNLIAKYESVESERQSIEERREKLNNAIYKYEILAKQIAEVADEIARLEDQLPERCPTCGKLFKEK